MWNKRLWCKTAVFAKEDFEKVNSEEKFWAIVQQVSVANTEAKVNALSDEGFSTLCSMLRKKGIAEVSDAFEVAGDQIEVLRECYQLGLRAQCGVRKKYKDSRPTWVERSHRNRGKRGQCGVRNKCKDSRPNHKYR
jgi:hypothetical protein